MMLRYDTLTTCIFLYLTLLDVKCHVQEMMLRYDTLTRILNLTVVDVMHHVWLVQSPREPHEKPGQDG